nr:hypothetical protein Iba_chr12aCG9660 [Ipomoea batatas]
MGVKFKLYLLMKIERLHRKCVGFQTQMVDGAPEDTVLQDPLGGDIAPIRAHPPQHDKI